MPHFSRIQGNEYIYLKRFPLAELRFTEITIVYFAALKLKVKKGVV